MPNFQGKFFDAHCHVFNLEYLILEALNMAWDKITGHYPLAPADKNIKTSDPFKDLMSWIIQMGSAVFGSEERNAGFIFSCARDVFNKDVCITPLMMDIYFMFYPPVNAVTRMHIQPEKVSAVTNTQHEAEFDKFIREVMAENKEGLQKADKQMRTLSLTPEHKGLAGNDAVLDMEKMIHASAEKVKTHAKTIMKNADPYRMTAGFQQEINSLTSLRNKYPDRVFPFLAVDPRRTGLIDYIRAGNLVDKNKGPFFGIKIYPRLGYMPDIQEFKALYDYCELKGIPITSHCSSGGFPVQIGNLFKDWPYSEYGSPLNFENIFQKRPNIKINLAHFGDSGTNAPWAQAIARQIKAYPGRVFTDMSCTGDKQNLSNWANTYGKDPEVFSRTMFGSDFDVLYFTAIGITLQAYDGFYKAQFTQQELDMMMGETPRKFLA